MNTRTTKVYSITMPPEMGQRAEQLAKREGRTMSELMRETFRRHEIEEAERRLFTEHGRAKHLAEFKRILAGLQQESKRKGLNRKTMRQIDAEIAAVRKSSARKKVTKRPVS